MPDDDDTPQEPRNVVPIGRPGRGQGQQEAAAVIGARALELRMSGATYQQISDALNISSKGVAYAHVQAALRVETERVAELREEYRDLQLARIERLTRAHWVKALEGDIDASKHVLTLMQRQAALLGLDAPKQVQISGGVAEAADDALTRLREVVIGDVLDSTADD